jgi:tetratricopeptide (TPR) repeat protein
MQEAANLSRRYPIALASAVLLVFTIAGSALAITPTQRDALAAAAEQQICDPTADYYLGMENYPKAIALHETLIRQHPGKALAYYHLGFAYGVMGNRDRELADYQKAVELGLSDWELFLNLGRLYMETNRLDQASDAFRLAALLGPYHPETHYNLGLVYERLNAFQKAEQEILLSLQLEPDQADARNTLGVIYAEEGNFVLAHREWADLHHALPDYAPARANLEILQHVERGTVKTSIQLGSFAQAP